MPNRARNLGPMEKGQRSVAYCIRARRDEGRESRTLADTDSSCVRPSPYLALSQSALAGDCANWNGDGFFGATSIGALQECLRGRRRPQHP